MGFEDEYKRGKEKKDPITAFLPALGLILMLAFGAIAFVLHEPAHEKLQELITDFPEEKEVGYAVGGVIFFLLMLFAGFFYALFQPKREHQVTESELRKEKKAIEREAVERKQRRKKIRQEAFKQRKERENQQKE